MRMVERIGRDDGFLSGWRSYGPLVALSVLFAIPKPAAIEYMQGPGFLPALLKLP